MIRSGECTWFQEIYSAIHQVVADPGFSWGGAPTSKAGVLTYYFASVWRAPWILQCQANGRAISGFNWHNSCGIEKSLKPRMSEWSLSTIPVGGRKSLALRIQICYSQTCLRHVRSYLAFCSHAKALLIFYMEKFILLFDGDRHCDGYVTIILVNANKILVLPIRRVFVKVNTPLPGFCRE